MAEGLFPPNPVVLSMGRVQAAFREGQICE